MMVKSVPGLGLAYDYTFLLVMPPPYAILPYAEKPPFPSDWAAINGRSPNQGMDRVEPFDWRFLYMDSITLFGEEHNS